MNKFDREANRFLRRVKHTRPDEWQMDALVGCLMRKMDVVDNEIFLEHFMDDHKAFVDCSAERVAS